MPRGTRGTLWALGLATAIVALAALGAAEQQTGGDQFLDGIGETALVARYQFNGNGEDSSRNQFHAMVRSTAGNLFIEDGQRRVLLLTGDGSHLQLPPQTLAEDDTISVSTWLFLPTGASGTVFDFGQNQMNRVSASASLAGVRAAMIVDGKRRAEAVSSAVSENQWLHVALVLDPAKKTLALYVDGAKVGEGQGASALTSANQLFIGRSIGEPSGSLHGRLRDFRIYRIALSDEQVRTIRTNGLPGRQNTGRRGTPPVEISTANIPAESPLTTWVSSVPDITVETIAGVLPKLPATIPANYRDKRPVAAFVTGPEVRVIWPAPTDNSQVLKPGRYAVTGKVPGTSFEPKATVIVKMPVGTRTPPSRLVEAFRLSDVVLDKDAHGRDTPFIKNRDKFLRGLAATNPDSFLYNFRETFGQPQPAGAKPLEGWDNQTTRLRGHASGHYLTAIAQAYASTTYDEALRANFLQKMNYLVDTLYDLSQKSGRPAASGGPAVADPTAVPPGPDRKGYDSNLRAGQIRTDYWNWGVGFISGYPPDQFIMLEKGATYGTQDTQIWAPYYTLHKILAGLLDSYEVAGNEKALQIAKGMGAWSYARLKALPPETRVSMWSRYIAGEYGGMNEVMARLFRLTGDKQFLEGAKLFDNINFFYGNANREHGLAKNVDTIRGKHANQHIPQITGALETFRNTKEMPYYLIASNFWDMVNAGYMYSIGGVAGAKVPNNAECFTAQPYSLWQNGFANGGQNETCATYNLLKLDRQLFMYDQTAKYMDHYERALYNHILASVAEDNPGNTYHVPLNPGAQKRFGNANMNGFTCCNGTALESNTKLQDTIYFHSADNKTLYVNLFVPSTLNWRERNIAVQQITDFPYADTTKLVIKGAGAFDLKVRVPGWATQGFFVKVNGRTQPVKATPGSYVSLGKAWKANDTIELRMPFRFYLDPVVDQPNVASILYGPVLLAAEESGPRTDWRQVTLNAADMSKSIAGDPSALRFTVGDATLKPFYETYGRSSVYLHVTLR
jgi:uncharacterized protein